MGLGAPSLHAQTFDATNLREPVEIGTQGRMQAGDDPAWSRPDFDDSRWVPVDATTRLHDLFPGKQTDIVWWRLHLKVSPQQTDLALQAYDIARAFEVYVNGEKLIESGQVQPFVSCTRGARLIARIPAAQLRNGSITIAIRARATRTWWTSILAAVYDPMLTLGNEAALRNRSTLSAIRGSA